jgi:hypothetical protein
VRRVVIRIWGRRAVIVGLVLFLAGGAALWWVSSRPRITRESVGRIHTAMTHAEVEAAIGGPPGYYGGNVRFYDACMRRYETYLRTRPPAEASKDYAIWVIRGGSTSVVYDGDRVIDRYFATDDYDPGFFHRLKASLGQ